MLVQLFRDMFTVVGAIGALCTTLSLFFPKGSQIGYALSKVGTDVKGHTQPADPVTPEDDNAKRE